jgi:hypothetical protein
MNIFTTTRIAGVALPLLLAGALAPSATAQVRRPPRDTSMSHGGAMSAASGMAAMMSGPHHALALAYDESLATFARALQADVMRTDMVNVELARPAVTEMRRSFDQMKMHHEAQMSSGNMMMKMPMPTDSSRTTMMAGMQTKMAAIETHLSMLEAEVNSTAPNATKVREHTAEILQAQHGSMRMPANASGRKGRPHAR